MLKNLYFYKNLRNSGVWCRGLTGSATPATSADEKARVQLNFSDHRTVFRFKKTTDLLRSLAILRICSVNLFVDNSLEVMRKCERVFGARIFSMFARPTFYAQFVGGDTEQELRDTCARMSEAGLHLMVCPAMEEDEGEAGINTKYANNMEYIKEIGQIMIRAGETHPCLQFKVTAMMPGDLVTTLTTNIGTNIQLGTLAQHISRAIDSSDLISYPWLTEEENNQLNQGIKLVKQFGDQAVQSGIKLLVDAEYTYMNPGISAVALGMMLSYNKSTPVVWNTYQCYLKAALDTISSELKIVEDRNRCFGAKIVRGAYMEKERRLARDRGYPDPVNDTYEDTGIMYDRVAEYMMNHIKNVGDRCNIVLGTHNEASVLKAANKILELGILPDSRQVVFGQIYGMADQISVPLSTAGFKVYKSVPYGPLDEVLPYLSRRAAENRVVLAGARRELELLMLELKTRAGLRTSAY